MKLTVSCFICADKWWLARCSDSFVSDIAHRRTRKRSFGYFQLNTSISTPHLQKTWTDLDIHSIKQKGIHCPQFGEVLWNPNQKKISNISSAYNVGHLGYKQSFTIKVKTIPQSTETFVQISHYIQRAGVTYSLVMFSLIMMKWYDKVNKSNHWF